MMRSGRWLRAGAGSKYRSSNNPCIALPKIIVAGSTDAPSRFGGSADRTKAAMNRGDWSVSGVPLHRKKFKAGFGELSGAAAQTSRNFGSDDGNGRGRVGGAARLLHRLERVLEFGASFRRKVEFDGRAIGERE